MPDITQPQCQYCGDTGIIKSNLGLGSRYCPGCNHAGAQTLWRLSWRTDPVARTIADRHYNRQKVGASGFVPPGRCLVLLADTPALWVTSWPNAEYVNHAWAGAWINSCFRKEGPGVASHMIRLAVAHTLWKWPEPPPLGMITFVNPAKVGHKREPGYCYKKAGFQHVGYTKGGLWAWQLLPQHMPSPMESLPRKLPVGAAPTRRSGHEYA